MQSTYTTVRSVTPEELAAITAPQGNERWKPQSHRAMLDFVTAAFAETGRRIGSQQLYTYRGDQRLIGILHSEEQRSDGLHLVVTFTNSLDMSLSLSAYLGFGAADTATTTASIDLATRKATKRAVPLFQQELKAAMANLDATVTTLDEKVERMRQHIVTDHAAHSVLLYAYDRAILSSRNLRTALRLWEKPPHAILEPRNAFTLMHTVLYVRRNAWKSSPKTMLKDCVRLEDLVMSYVV